MSNNKYSTEKITGVSKGTAHWFPFEKLHFFNNLTACICQKTTTVFTYHIKTDGHFDGAPALLWIVTEPLQHLKTFLFSAIPYLQQ